MDIKIQAIHFTADSKLKDFVEKKVTKLETFFDKIIDAEVFLKLENDGSSVKNKIAEIKVNIPGSTLFATESSKVFEESIDLSISSLTKQLKKVKEKNRK